MELQLSKIWKINGKPIYEPSTYSLGVTNLQVKADRPTASGILHKKTIRWGIIKNGSFGYDAMSSEQLGYMESLAMQRKEFFDLTYLHYGTIRTIECYCNDFDAELYNAVLENGLWKNVTFVCIER